MKLMQKALTFCALALLVFAISCGHPQTLTSITMQPSTVTTTGTSAGFAAGTFTEKFTAYGNFVNPLKQVDISDKVTWTVDPAAFASVDNVGNVTPNGNGCGTILVTATAHKGVVGPGDADEVVVGQATLDVIETDNANCGGQAPVLTVAVTGSGLVNGFINTTTATTISGCTQNGGPNCVATESTGTVVLLQASAPATFSSNCSPVSSSSCQVVLSGNTNVTVGF